MPIRYQFSISLVQCVAVVRQRVRRNCVKTITYGPDILGIKIATTILMTQMDLHIVA